MAFNLDFTGQSGSGGSGGTISIVPERTTLQCAPDSVGFTVDLSEATFDTAGPSGGEIYDARHHYLHYSWDFGDSGNYSSPVNILDEHKARNIAYGPYVRHVYTEADTYTVTLTVIEWSTGKQSITTEEITVVTADSVHPTTQTICVSTSGNFDEAPSDAEEVTATDFSTAWSTYADASNPIRWLFRAGETFTCEVGISSANDSIMIGSYDSGAKPVFDVPTDGAIGITIYSSHVEDIRIEGVSLEGNYDPTTEAPPAGGGTVLYSAHGISQSGSTLILSEVDFTGFAYSSFIVPTTITAALGVHLSDCTMTDFGGQYPNFIGWLNNSNSWVAYTGCRIAQNVDGVDATGIKAPLRIETVPRAHLGQNDWFHTDSSQPVLKIQESNFADGGLVNVDRGSVEGAGTLIRILGNTGETLGRSTVHNIIIDGMVMVGGYNTQAFLLSNSTGITMRNCLCILPASPRYGSSQFRRFCRFGDVGTYDSSVADAPVEIYNNTFRMDRTVANNDSVSGQVILSEFYPSLAFNDVSQINNIMLLTNDATFAPLSTTALWTPRLKGYRDPSTTTLDDTYETPADAVKETKPQAGSVALAGATSGDIAYTDIIGTVRADPPNDGAWAGTAS